MLVVFCSIKTRPADLVPIYNLMRKIQSIFTILDEYCPGGWSVKRRDDYSAQVGRKFFRMN